MYPKNAGYRPAQLAIIGIISCVAGLLLPVLKLDPNAGTLLATLGIWVVIAAYVLYAVNIYDIRATETRVAAVLMIAIPLAVYWMGERFLQTLEGDPTAAAVSLGVALALGSIVSLALLWTLGTVRRGALRLLHRHERRRHWPSAVWVIVGIVVISLYSFSSTAAIPEIASPSGFIQGVAENIENIGSVQSPGIAIPTAQPPTVARTTPSSRQDVVTPIRSSNYQAASTQVIVARAPSAGRQGAADLTAIELAVFSLTNQERQQQGLPALQWDAALASVARAHSQDMAETNFFSHTNLRGQDPTARAVAAGYPVRRALGGGWYSTGIGENIDKMPTGNVVGQGYVNNDAQSIAQAMVQSWMNSPGHRENILNTQYARLGVGVAYDGTLYYLGTQDFI